MNLDLSVFENRTWEVKMFDGGVIHIKKPSQKQLILLEGMMRKVEKEVDTEAQLKLTTESALFILNNNQEGKKYTAKVLEDKPVDILYAIYFGYRDFIKEVMSNPN